MWKAHFAAIDCTIARAFDYGKDIVVPGIENDALDGRLLSRFHISDYYHTVSLDSWPYKHTCMSLNEEAMAATQIKTIVPSLRLRCKRCRSVSKNSRRGRLWL